MSAGPDPSLSRSGDPAVEKPTLARMDQIDTDSAAVDHQPAAQATDLSADTIYMPFDADAHQHDGHSTRIDSAAESPHTPTTEDITTPTQSPIESVSACTRLSNQALHNQLTSSPNPKTPSRPSTPTTPTYDLSRVSIASTALSQSSLDYDHLSPGQVDDILSTPRVSSAKRHMRKVSSLEIIQNRWAPPERQSTLFDNSYEPLPTATSAPDFQGDMGLWEVEGGELKTDFTTDRRSMSETLDTVDMLEVDMSTAESPSEVSWRRSGSASSEDGGLVNWQALDKTEEQEKEDKDLPHGAEDETTAFLLARLEQENAKFAADPKATHSKANQRTRAASRPPSIAQLKKMVSRHNPPAIRLSMASDTAAGDEPPPMTELEFWAALVQDYPTTAARLPTLTVTKIRAGVPPPLRGVVWSSMSGARDAELEETYERLLEEKSPYEGIINKDVGRSFPGVELFRDADGEGQKMLGRVLRCFSLHDKDIGYCQGIGFLVGPLLMNMGERDAFCVLTRLMEHYSLRPSFLPSLSGLHMRIYQFSSLLKQHHSKLFDHLANLGVEPAYLSQWFLSCFAVTCPLPMLFRIYDVIFAEGANETVMRVALSLLRRHEEKMLATMEFEEVMRTLLGRDIWDCYGSDADVLVDDFTSLGDIVTHARLAELEKEFENQSSETVSQSTGLLLDVQNATSRFLGRIWAPGQNQTPSKSALADATHTPKPSVSTLSPISAEKYISSTSYSFLSRPGSFLRRSPSRPDVNAASDFNSSGDSTSSADSGARSVASTALTELEASATETNGILRESMADNMSMKSKPESIFPLHGRETQYLHYQIEDLLTAMGEMQREHAQLAAMLQREREERGEDHRVMRQLLSTLKKDGRDDRRKTMPAGPQALTASSRTPQARPLSVGGRAVDEIQSNNQQPKTRLEILIEKAQERLETNVRFSANLETKAQLRSTLTRTREQLASAESQSNELKTRLDSAEACVTAFQLESDDLRAEVKELRVRVAEEFKVRQKLEHELSEFKAQARSMERREASQRKGSLPDMPTINKLDSSPDLGIRKNNTLSLPPHSVTNNGGLREFKLSRRDSPSALHIPRSTSRFTTPVSMETVQKVLATGGSPLGIFPSSPPGTASSISADSAASTSAAVSNPLLLPVPRTGFARRTTSLAAQDILATPQHEVVPEEALLLELVNSKTSEALARQEVDELKKALSVSKRKQEQYLTHIRAELEAAKIETAKANQAAQAAIYEVEALQSARSSVIGSLALNSDSEEAADIRNSHAMLSTGKSAEEVTSEVMDSKKVETTPSAGRGWFWQRNNLSRSGPMPIKNERE